MCRTTKCCKCQKITWAGCGQHVNQVMAHVPRNERCSCGQNAQKVPVGKGGLLARLLGR